MLMDMMNGEPNETRCLRCGRKIMAGSYGPTCLRKIRAAAQTADLSAWTPAQVEAAIELIADGGVVPSTREGVFHTVSTDGTEIHRTHPHGCNCTNGLQTRPPRPCLHRCAVVIVLASQAPVILAGAPLTLAA